MPQLREANLVQRRLAGVATHLLRAELPARLRRRVPRSLRAVDPLDVLRLVLAIAQGAMICVTWRLWQVRSDIVNLPLVDGLPQVSVGWVLLVTLVVAVARPREGIVAHVVVLAFALLSDQMRLQGEFVSVALLLVATGPWRHARTLGWAHLGSMWLWAGVAKATNAGFGDTTARIVADNLGLSGWRTLFAWAIPLFEIALGVMVARSAWRAYAVGPAVVLHIGAIISLRMDFDWEILWWNLALVAAALVLLRQRRPRRARSAEPSATPVHSGLRAVMVAGLFAYPAGMYLGVVDPYLAHGLYNGSVPTADVCNDQGCTRYAINVSGAAIDAPVPPSPRIFEEWFQTICRPGDELHVTGMQLHEPLDGLPVTESSVSVCEAVG